MSPIGVGLPGWGWDFLGGGGTSWVWVLVVYGVTLIVGSMRLGAK